MTTVNYPYRFLARVIIEAVTPLAIGNGDKNTMTDSLVATDVNGLPYIPGTSIAGVIRSMIGEESAKQFFGFQKSNNDAHGSNIIFTEAKILNSKGLVVDGLGISASQDELLRHYNASLPIRQHVRINGKGTAEDKGKFDQQIVFAGSRFCFEIEMVASSLDDSANFELAIQQVQKSSYRIGGGSRHGYGKIKVVSLFTRKLDLSLPADLSLYLDKSSCLSSNWKGWQEYQSTQPDNAEDWIAYTLQLKPEDFFLFSSGFGDNEADITSVKERKVLWNNSGNGHLSDNSTLIPASSIKGALSHRTAYHWNRLKGYFAGDSRATTGSNNPAVQALFGYEDPVSQKQKRGNVLFHDIIDPYPLNEKLLNHVSIDRFTSGAVDGALFQEKPTFGNDHDFPPIEILVNKKAFNEQDADTIQMSFEEALKDICRGFLPLGGGTQRGNGIFYGTLSKNNLQIYPEPKGGQQ